MLRKNGSRIGEKTKLHPNTEIGGWGGGGVKAGLTATFFKMLQYFFRVRLPRHRDFVRFPACWFHRSCLSACLSACLGTLSTCLPYCLPACLSGWLAVFLSVCVYVCVSVFLSVCLSVWMSVYLSVGCSRALRLLLPPLLLHSVVVCLSC